MYAKGGDDGGGGDGGGGDGNGGGGDGDGGGGGGGGGGDAAGEPVYTSTSRIRRLLYSSASSMHTMPRYRYLSNSRYQNLWLKSYATHRLRA